MAGDGEEPVRIDRGLAMLGRDNDGGRFKETLIFQSHHHLADGVVRELDLIQHIGGGIARGIRITTLHAVLDQLLADADCLEVHPENHRYRGFAATQVRLAVDLVHDGIHFELVVAPDLLEACSPIARGGVDDRAIVAVRRRHRQGDDIGVDSRRIIVVHVGRRYAIGVAVNGRVGGMLVGPPLS